MLNAATAVLNVVCIYGICAVGMILKSLTILIPCSLERKSATTWENPSCNINVANSGAEVLFEVDMMGMIA
jgi:hypothetical protein